MRLYFFLSLLALLFLNALALNFFERAILATDTPACSTWCSAKAAKKIGVSYWDGKGNCALPEFHSEWQQCLHKRCSGRDRRKSILIRWELCDGYGIDTGDFPKEAYILQEIQNP